MMTSEELAKCVSKRCNRVGVSPKLEALCTKRILGVGHDQYAQDDLQVFESITLEELLIMLNEEIADIIVYAEMLSIRITRPVLQETTNIRLQSFLESITSMAGCAYMGSTAFRLL